MLRLTFNLLLILLLSGCTNQFEHKEYKWKHIARSEFANPKDVYVDENRIYHEGDISKVWTKMVFDELEPIQFNSKEGSQTLMVKRVESSVWYDCKRRTSKLVSYQLYDENGEFIYNQWLNQPVEEYIQKGTVDEDLFIYLCVAKRREAAEQNKKKN